MFRKVTAIEKISLMSPLVINFSTRASLSLSKGHYQLAYQQVRKGFIYFMVTLRLVYLQVNALGE